MNESLNNKMLPQGMSYTHLYATSTINSDKSRRRLLNKMLDELKDQKPKAKEVENYINALKVSNEYKIRLLRMYIRVYPDNEIPNIKKYSIRQKKMPIEYREHLMTGIEQLIKTGLTFLRDLKDKNLNTAHQYSSSYIETMVAIAITTATNLRSNEILQLTIMDLGKMLKHEKISIRLKAKKNLTTVIPHPKFTLMYPYIIYALAESYDVRKKDNTYTPRFQSITAKAEFIENPDFSPICMLNAFTCTSSIINRHISNIFLNLTKRVQKNIGLKAIRTYNTTQIINAGEPELASIFNRHTNKNIVETYYNLPAPMAQVNAIYEDVNFDQNFKQSLKEKVNAIYEDVNFDQNSKQSLKEKVKI